MQKTEAQKILQGTPPLRTRCHDSGVSWSILDIFKLPENIVTKQIFVVKFYKLGCQIYYELLRKSLHKYCRNIN